MSNLTVQAKIKTSQQQVNDNAVKLIDRMFRRLKSLKPAWRRDFDTIEDYNYTKQVWFEELAKAGVITPQKLKRGLDIAATNNSPFFPCVGVFIEWCNTTDYAELGLPTADELPARVSKFQSFYCTDDEFKFEFKSNAEYWLLTDLCGRSRRDQWTQSEFNKQCEQALKTMVKRIESGEIIPEPRPQIPKTVSVPTTPEKAMEFIKNIKTTIGMAKAA